MTGAQMRIGSIATVAVMSMAIGAGAPAVAQHVAPAGASAIAPAVAPATPAPIDRQQRMSAADRAAIDAEAAAYLSSAVDGTPGLWLAVWDPARGYYEQAYGHAELGGSAAKVTDHLLIGSITKTVFATAVLQQVAKGRVSLTDTVKELDPVLARRYPTTARTTVGQLLGMTSRIPDYADAAVAEMFADPQSTFTRDQLISLGLSAGKPIAAPGGYSTTNYLLLGKLMRTVTGKTPERLVNDVLAQAGMRKSTLQRGNAVVPNPKAHGYVGALAIAELGSANPSVTATTDVTDWTMTWGKEGGGATSTIGDLATWGSLCLGDALLPKKVVAKRLQTTAIDAGDYGLGIIRQGDWLAHSGQAIGYEANVACNPATGAVVAYAVNSTYGMLDLGQFVGPAAWPAYAKAAAGG